MGFPDGTSGKESAYQCRALRDVGLIPELQRAPGGGQYSCLENPVDRGDCQTTAHRFTKS